MASSSRAARTKPRTGENSSPSSTFTRLPPLDAGGALALGRHQLVGEADADHRADQRVRGGVRQAERPGAEVPQDRGDQQREDHRVAGGRADLQDQLHRQQGDDGVGHRARGQHDPEEVEGAGPDHRHHRRHRVGVDHRRHRVGGVVEAVHELEGQGDEERQGRGARRPRSPAASRRPRSCRGSGCNRHRRGRRRGRAAKATRPETWMPPSRFGPGRRPDPACGGAERSPGAIASIGHDSGPPAGRSPRRDDPAATPRTLRPYDDPVTGR